MSTHTLPGAILSLRKAVTAVALAALLLSSLLPVAIAQEIQDASIPAEASASAEELSAGTLTEETPEVPQTPDLTELALQAESFITVENPREPIRACAIVSDTTTTQDGHASALVSPIHPLWTAAIGSASWIWGENPIADAKSETTQTFTKQFYLVGLPASAMITIAADNSYEAYLNGTLIHADPNEYNFTDDTQDTVYIPIQNVQVGSNTLVFKVTNHAREDGTPQSNPAGLAYTMQVVGADCADGNFPEPEPNPGDDEDSQDPGTGTTTQPITPSDNGSSSRGGGSRSRSRNRDAGEVLGAATTTVATSTDASCGILLTSFLKEGMSNDLEQVRRLQGFLASNLGIVLPQTGSFGQLTDAAVRSFQVKYGENVLTPWVGQPASGIASSSDATGYVYKTTQWKINMLHCPALDLAFPELD